MPKLSYKERARLRREKEILRTAARMIRDNGYINLNMDDLADEVGISKPTLYQHFRGKDDMVAKAMKHTIEQMEQEMDDMDKPCAIDKLEGIMRYMLSAHTDPDGFSVSIMRDGSSALRHLRNTTSDETLQAQLRVNQKIYALVEQAKKEGDIDPNMSNIVVVGMMFSSLFILQGPEIMRDKSAKPEQLIEQVITFFRRGVEAKNPYPAAAD